ncbi:MAG: hypothetical protein JJLCMIEE_01690 [Acidimicrobiales bacterium]|nr:hypothetical protein [Acidimicrobiales bacterium]
MGVGQIILVVLAGVVTAAALCWFIVATAVRRARPPVDMPRRGTRPHVRGGH